jgi:hypothetical protein
VPRSVREAVAGGLDSKGVVKVGAAAGDAADDKPLTLAASNPGAAYIAAYSPGGPASENKKVSDHRGPCMVSPAVGECVTWDPGRVRIGISMMLGSRGSSCPGGRTGGGWGGDGEGGNGEGGGDGVSGDAGGGSWVRGDGDDCCRPSIGLIEGLLEGGGGTLFA